MGNTFQCITAPAPVASPRGSAKEPLAAQTDQQTFVAGQMADLFTTPREISKITAAYSVGEQIGHSGTAVVFAVAERSTRKRFAMKKIQKSLPNSNGLVLQEVKALSTLEHPNILRFCGVWHDRRNFYIITSICEGGDLVDQIHARRHKRLTEKAAKSLLRRILSAVEHAHSRNVVHRDIKIEHVMFQSRNPGEHQPVIIDWGDAMIVEDDEVIGKEKFAGTPEYLSPEVSRARRGWEMKKSDMWSVGVTAYVLLYGRMPFSGGTLKELFNEIRFASISFDDLPAVSDQAIEFLRACLNRDIIARVSAADALKMAWFVS